MGLITRSTLILESAQRAALLNALKARLEIGNQQQVASAVRQLDRFLVDLVSIESLRLPTTYLSLPKRGGSNQPQTPFAWYFSPYSRAYFQLEIRAEPRLIAVRESDAVRVLELLQDFNWRDDVPGLLPAENVGWAASPDQMYRINAEINGRKSEMRDIFPSMIGSDQGDSVRGDLDPKVELESPQRARPSDAALPQDASETSGRLDSVRIPPAPMVGPIFPLWLQDELFLVRKVSTADEEWLQGCWVDWPRLKNQLLRGLEASLPRDSDLVPVVDRPPVLGGGYASWAPIKIVTPVVRLPSTPMPTQGGWLNLAVGWIFMLVAGLAVGMLLHTVMRESRRRETFVSAVTHELRTPLTAFRLYTDLLSKNPEPDKIRVYAKTLESEAERLSHLVENVLTYSRLEKRGITSHHRMVAVETLLDPIVPRLEEHCLRNQMLLDYVEPERALRQREILTDPSAVERILFNLVDNACKYGRTDEEALVQIEVTSVGGDLLLRVRDFGPGMSPGQKRRMFQAYNHGQISTETPNRTIGLGLHICQQLALALGGTLRYQDAHPGSQFELRLPLGAQ